MKKKLTSSEIRRLFLDYFAALGHQIVPSSSLIPGNDPTLLFTNAGMVQFKEAFLGHETRAYSRASTAQRCVRAGGKHNDLDNVGYTARHHTFFEMLGNFSFGDYFKHEAIVFAWKFLTEILCLPPERLWITVYEDDDEAAEIWLHEIGVSPDRFSRCGDADNFWSMGDTGPCGPCTEIFYDHGPEIAGGPPGSPDADGDRYIEIWNLVFMQYNRDAEGHLHPLPKPSVDTGMGLERITAVVQGVHTNYDTDLFRHLIEAIQQLKPGVDSKTPSLKVIADHLRASAFLIADGVYPGNEGRGYVLRRIIRRAVRHGRQLGLPQPFLARLLPALIEVMGEAYPELSENQALLNKLFTQEETQFYHTLESGLALLTEQIKGMKSTEINGEVAFRLYDTFGFPLDLTQDIAREQGLTVDLAGFEACMQQQRLLSQASNQFSLDYTKTEHVTEVSEFKGYEKLTESSTLVLLLQDNQKIMHLEAGSRAAVVLAATPFYAESGGQVGDRGQLTTPSGAVFQVEDTQKINEAIIHRGVLTHGVLKVGDEILAEVDGVRRAAIRCNHTATHLLHAALKKIVNPQIQQKGSLVDAERARFDFSAFEALSSAQIRALEDLVNARIRTNEPVHTEMMTLEAAKSSGAVALFGEKYSQNVRVLSVADFSKELCGGTHVNQTGDIGLFKIVSEYGVANGVRRIEFMTGAFALDWVNAQLRELSTAAEIIKTTPALLGEKLLQLTNTIKKQEKNLDQLKGKLVASSLDELLKEAIEMNGIHLLIKELSGADSALLRSSLDQLKSKLARAVIVLYAIQDDKIQVVAGISSAILTCVPPAGNFVKHLCGRGGGRHDMAQGGGQVPANLAERIEQMKGWIQRV